MYVNIQLICLGTVREVVVENEDGGHTIFINDQLSHDAQIDAYEHAMEHIKADDFARHGNATEIEFERHKKSGDGSPRNANKL